jgi:hypothetical protein
MMVGAVMLDKSLSVSTDVNSRWGQPNDIHDYIYKLYLKAWPGFFMTSAAQGPIVVCSQRVDLGIRDAVLPTQPNISDRGGQPRLARAGDGRAREPYARERHPVKHWQTAWTIIDGPVWAGARGAKDGGGPPSKPRDRRVGDCP